MNYRRIVIPTLVLAGLLLPCHRGFAAFEIFLKLDGVEGESIDAKHPKEIEVLSFSHGLSMPPPLPGGGGGGKASFSDFNITKLVDKSTPILFLKCAQGAHINEALLVLRQSGASGFEFYKIKLTDVLITSVQTSGSSGGDNRPVESISLNFTKIEWTYVPQKADGTADTAVVTTWDLATSTP
jgi:type VI secretion system secreted protein Hcp